MKLSCLSLLTFLGVVLSSPLGPEMSAKRQFAYEQLSFTFYGGPASYQLSFPADGSTYNTYNNMSVSLIDPGSFNALYNCNFWYDIPTGGKTPSLSATGNGNEVAVGAPVPVTMVSCEPTGANGQCLPVYATCEWCSLTGGCFLLNCCSGYCAATKCRPT